MNNLYNTILSPIITEKSTKISENNQFVFKVKISSNKKEIKEAIEKLFKVKIKGKNKIFKGTKGKRSDYKKAVICLKKGENIDYSGGISWWPWKPLTLQLLQEEL